MTARLWQLESYDPFPAHPVADPVEQGVSEERLEDVRLEAFDKGYKAGWDDAAKAYQDDQNHFSSEFAKNLTQLSINYSEARGAALKDAEAFLEGVLVKLLPDSLPELVVSQIMEQLSIHLGATVQPSIEVTVAPGNVERLQTLLSAHETTDVKVSQEPSLGPGQAYLRVAEREEQIDLDAALQDAHSILRDLFATDITHSNQEPAEDG